MLEDNRIDNLFRSALEPFEATPSEKVWSSLDTELGKRGAAITDSDSVDGKKKSKRRFLLWLLALTVVSFGSYEYFSGNLSDIKNQALRSEVGSSNAKPQMPNTKLQTNSSEPASSKMTITSSNDLVADNSPKPVINITNRGAEKSRGEALNSGVTMNSSAVPSSSEKSNAGTSKVTPKVKSSASEKGTVAGNHSSRHSSSTKASVGNSNPSSGESKNANGGLFAKVNTNNIEKTVEQNSTNNNSTESSSTGTSETNDAAIVTPSNSSSESTENVNSEKTNGESASTTSSTETSTTTNATEPAAIQPAAPVVAPAPPQLDAKPPIGNSLTKLTVAAFYSPEMANRYFTNGNSSSSQSAGTSSSERFGFSYNTGAMLRYDISAFGRWSLGVGASFSTLQQITSVTTSYIIPAETNGHSSPGHQSDSTFFQGFSYSTNNNQYTFNTSCGSVHLQNPPGMLVSNNSNKADTIKFTTNTTMLLKYINVPLTIRYTPDFLTKGRFSVYADAGVSLSFLVNKQAHVVIDDSYSETSSDISGLRSMYYGWLFGIGAQYQFCKGLSVFAEPDFRGSVSSITDGNSQSFYPYSLGVNTGLSYHF